MQQKVIQVGNSLAITLPKKFVSTCNIKAGQEVFVDVYPENDLVQMSTKGNATSALTPEFYEWLKKFNKKYKEALSELATK